MYIDLQIFFFICKYNMYMYLRTDNELHYWEDSLPVLSRLGISSSTYHKSALLYSYRPTVCL